MNQLTPKEWALYRILKENTANNKPLSIKEICDLLPDYFKLGKSNGGDKNTNCSAIYKAIDTINNSTEVEKIIIVDNNRIYLGNEQQTKEYASKLKVRALKQFKKYWNVVNKSQVDGQGKLVSCQNNVIDKASRARDFVESFVKEGVSV